MNYEIEEQIGVISQRNSGWAKELNIVNWYGKGGRFDIREWSPDHDGMGKGITMSEDELLRLYELLKEYFHEETVKSSEKEETEDIEDIFLK